MSRTESIATPALPTSPVTRSWSESYPRWVGKIEGDREPALARGQIAAKKCIGLFGCRETSVLTDCPRLHDVHSAVRAAQKGRNPRCIVEMVEALEVIGSIEAFDRNVLGRQPVTASLAIRSLDCWLDSRYLKSLGASLGLDSQLVLPGR